MPVLSIRLYGDSILRKKASPVENITPEVVGLAENMIKTMAVSKGIGLAAPQVGKSIRLIIVTFGFDSDTPYTRILINPSLIEHGEETDVAEEGCLSIPDTTGRVRRWTRVRFTAQNEEGIHIDETATGITARILQHEIDHLDGILFIDRLAPFVQDMVKRKLRKKLKLAKTE